MSEGRRLREDAVVLDILQRLHHQSRSHEWGAWHLNTDRDQWWRHCKDCPASEGRSGRFGRPNT